MNRRAFLRFLATGVLVGPRLVKDGLDLTLAHPVAEAGSRPPPPLITAQQVIWYEKEFDWGRAVGYAVSLVDPRTGEQRRNAVRLLHPSPCRHDPCDHIADGRAVARNLLTMWAEKEGLALPGVGPDGRGPYDGQALIIGFYPGQCPDLEARLRVSAKRGDEILEGFETVLPG